MTLLTVLLTVTVHYHLSLVSDQAPINLFVELWCYIKSYFMVLYMPQNFTVNNDSLMYPQRKQLAQVF